MIVVFIVVVPHTKHNFPGVLASSPAVEVVALSAGRESATATAKDVLPAEILTYITVSRVLSTFPIFVSEVVVVTIDLQSLPELCQLLLPRARIRRKIMSGASSSSNAHASCSTKFKSRLVIVSAIAMLPFRSAAITELSFTAAAGQLLAA